MTSTPSEIPVSERAGWRRARGEASLIDVFRSIKVPATGSNWRKFLAFLGPGYVLNIKVIVDFATGTGT